MNLGRNFYVIGTVLTASFISILALPEVAQAQNEGEPVCTIEWRIDNGATTTRPALPSCTEPFAVATNTGANIDITIAGKTMNEGEVIEPAPGVRGFPASIKVTGVAEEKYESEYEFAVMLEGFLHGTEQNYSERFQGTAEIGKEHDFYFSMPDSYTIRKKDFWAVIGLKPKGSSTTRGTDERFYMHTDHDLLFHDMYMDFDYFGTIGEYEKREDTAPSVMFLPGIMGSRLYADDGGCSNSEEYELWFSRDDCEQLRLKTKFTGETEHDIYTKANEDAVIDEILIQNIYKDWLGTLENWETDGNIAAYAAVPYDWRLQLDDLLQTTRDEETDEIRYDYDANITDSYIYQELERLAEAGDEVTIVAHSNGGLLAKQVLHELEKRDDPLLDQVSELVLVGVPQTGTPSSLIGILHGSELGKGWAATSEITRQIMNTAPFAHHLLPTEEYFQSIGSGSVIEIATGTSTDAWREKFGGHIEEVDTMYEFLSKDGGRQDPAADDLKQPEVVDPHLLQYAKVMGKIQADWEPPKGMETVQITGVGVETLGRLQYFTDTECVDRGVLPWRCNEYAPKLGYRVGEVDGDGTVVRESAAAMSGDRVTDLTAILADVANREGTGKVHNNFMEMPELHQYMSHRLGWADEPDYEYLLEDVDPIAESHIVYRLHSPVDIVVTNPDGERVSSSTSEIAGGTYRRYGEVQQVRVPFDRGPFDAVLQGTDDGSFTLEVEHQRGYEITERKQFTAIPVATTTKATLSGVGDGALVTDTLTIDYDGDGDSEAAFRAGTRAPVSVATSTATTSPETTDESLEPEDDNTDEVVVEEVESEAQPASTGTRVRPLASNPDGQVTGISTSTVTEEAMSYDDLYAALVALKEVLEQYETNIVS